MNTKGEGGFPPKTEEDIDIEYKMEESNLTKQEAVPSLSQKKTKGRDYSEISPNKRYIRFEEMYSQTASIKASFRGFDTKNGIEVVWQKIYLSDLKEAEQEPIMRSLNYLKEIQPRAQTQQTRTCLY